MKHDVIMVVGGAGFVGSHLVDSLIKAGANKVVVVDNMHLGRVENLEWAFKNGNVELYREDARYLTALSNIIDIEKPEVVFNLAVKCLPYGFVDPEGSFMTGVEIASNLANLIRKNEYKRLIHFSSSEAYGSAQITPMAESHPLNPTTPYGAGKASADLLLHTYYKLFDSNITILRPFNMYGPRQNMEKYSAVIPLTIRRILTGSAPVIEGTGCQTRDLTYVKDVTDFAVTMVDRDETSGLTLNLGYGSDIKIKELIFKICELMDYPKKEIKYNKPRPSDVKMLHSDNTLAESLYGYKPKTTLESGLKKTIKYLEMCLNENPSCN